MDSASRNRKAWFVIAGIVILIAVSLSFQLLRNRGEKPPLFEPVQAENPDARIAPTSRTTPEAVLQAVEKLRTCTASDEARDCLARLAEYFKSPGTSNATAEIIQVLDSGIDVRTTLGFKLNKDGSLKESPTLRTFLLDLLAQLDPVKAAAYAEKILNRMESADEWAVALRAYARGNNAPDSQAFLRDKFREMLANESWRNDPSVGFLEAFDVAVYTHDKALTPDIAKLIQQKENPAVAHAAYLALDRLVQVEPAAVLLQLQAQPALMTGRETTRADYFARADVTDPQQRKILENYLLDTSRTAVEMQKFMEIYPNANYMISQNLLTPTTTPNGLELAARDAGSLKAVEEWLGDSRFARLEQQLQVVKSRLAQFVKHQSEP